MCFSFPCVHSYVIVIQFDAHLIFFLAGFISPRIHNENSNEAFARAAEKFISNITASGCNSYCSAAGKHVSGVVLLFQSFNTPWLILISGVPIGAWARTQAINYSVVILSKRKKANYYYCFTVNGGSVLQITNWYKHLICNGIYIQTLEPDPEAGTSVSSGLFTLTRYHKDLSDFNMQISCHTQVKEG